MELRQLAYFVAVAEELHFTRAAERLRIAQPAVSQQIRRLEAELGERVFLRDRRSVTLTAAGAALLPHARAALVQVEHGKESIAALRGLVTGPLAIGLVHPLPGRRIVGAIGAFARRHPAITLSLQEGETDALLAALADGALHCAFIGLGPGTEPPPELASLVVAREPAVLAVHPAHALAARDTVALRRAARRAVRHAHPCRSPAARSRGRMCRGRVRAADRGRDERPRGHGDAHRRERRRRAAAALGAGRGGRRRAVGRDRAARGPPHRRWCGEDYVRRRPGRSSPRRANASREPATLSGIEDSHAPPREESVDVRAIAKRGGFFVVLLVAAVVLILSLPGIGEIRDRFASADPWWLVAAAICRRDVDARFRARAVVGLRPRDALAPRAGAGARRAGRERARARGRRGRAAFGAFVLTKLGVPAELAARRHAALFLITSAVTFVAIFLAGILTSVGVLAARRQPVGDVAAALGAGARDRAGPGVRDERAPAQPSGGRSRKTLFRVHRFVHGGAKTSVELLRQRRPAADLRLGRLLRVRRRVAGLRLSGLRRRAPPIGIFVLAATRSATRARSSPRRAASAAPRAA